MVRGIAPGQWRGGTALGTALALLSALSFAISGAFAKALLDAGWSPGAAVTARIVGAAVVLVGPAVLIGRRELRHLPSAAWPIIGYGALGVAGAQLCYFMALDTMSVAVALLIENTAPVLLVLWAWVSGRRRPDWRVLVGTVVTMAGLVLVLDLAGARLDPVGLAWAIGAALCNAGYFLISARAVAGVSSLTMTAGGIAVAALGIGAAALLGVLPIRVTTQPVLLAGATVAWWVPVAGLIGLSTILAYGSGLLAARRLGAQLASFIGLAEVVAAVAFAWLLTGESLVAVQLLGGAVMVAGVVAVRSGSLGGGSRSVRVPHQVRGRRHQQRRAEHVQQHRDDRQSVPVLVQPDCPLGELAGQQQCHGALAGEHQGEHGQADHPVDRPRVDVAHQRRVEPGPSRGLVTGVRAGAGHHRAEPHRDGHHDRQHAPQHPAQL